jgi:DNA-binding NarL/FixJ family response regulator
MLTICYCFGYCEQFWFRFILRDKLFLDVIKKIRTFVSYPREKEILQYIADGLTTKEIATKIYRDDETVKSHRRNLLIKLDAINMSVMIRKGCEQNLIKLFK